MVVVSTNRTLGGETGTFLLYLPLESGHKVIAVATCLLFRGASATGWNPTEVSDGQPIRQVFMGQWAQLGLGPSGNPDLFSYNSYGKNKGRGSWH